MRRSIILLVALVVIIIIPVQVSLAGTIIYRWTGTIVPLEANVDPWDIGVNGLPFTISGTVNDQTVDTQDLVDTAIFELSDAELVIDGAVPTFLSGRQAVFGDRNSGDSLSIHFDEVVFNGVREPFFATARLPISTFAFASTFESPPVFGPTLTIRRSGAGGERSSYIGLSNEGVKVTATPIPEPSTFVLAFLAMLAVGTSFWKRHGK